MMSLPTNTVFSPALQVQELFSTVVIIVNLTAFEDMGSEAKEHIFGGRKTQMVI